MKTYISLFHWKPEKENHETVKRKEKKLHVTSDVKVVQLLSGQQLASPTGVWGLLLLQWLSCCVAIACSCSLSLCHVNHCTLSRALCTVNPFPSNYI